MNNNSEHLKQQAIIALQEGRITGHEYDVYIKSLDTKIEIPPPITQVNTPATQPTQISKITISSLKKSWNNKDNTTRHNIIISAIFLFVIVGIVWTLSSTTGLTGFAVLNVGQENFSNNMTINNSEELNSIQISGTMYGEGSAIISYNTTNGTLRIATINSDLGLPRTNNPSYTPGDTITLDHEPTSYTAYLDDGANTIAVTLPLQAPETNATLLLVVNESDNLTTYKLPIIIGNTKRTTTFENLCDETCTITPITGNIIIETTGDAHITFNKIETIIEKNSAPMYAIAINPITTSEPTTIDLNTHFADVDGDTLYYSTSTSSTSNILIENNILTITPTTNGEETITIYSSDLKEITQGTFALTVTGLNSPEQVINSKINTTTNEINNVYNDTANNTENILNTTANSAPEIQNITPQNSLDCSNPNPNARPIECIQNSSINYFSEQEIFWYDTQRQPVARFTTIGNLMIKGELIENSDSTPNPNDFGLGYSTIDANIVPTIWIDSKGNLQLRGTIHEEQTQIVAPPNSYSFNNKRGITLAYATLETGDLYIRGNIFPYRKSVTS